MFDFQMVLAFGITFGILIMTIFYTFIRYVYSKELIYLSYALMQLFSLLYIVSYSQLFFTDVLIKEIALVGATLSAVVFAVGFYEGRYFPTIKTQKELIINTILLNVVILTSFYHYLLFEYLPYTVIYAILFISVIFNLKMGFKPTLIYVLGWSLFCIVLFIFDFKTYYIEQGFLDIVLVAFAIEAVLFTISVAYQYSSLKNENKDYEQMLFQQTKLAKSGEMIANITHQFRQPLNNIAYILMNVKKRFENENLDQPYFEKKFIQANDQLQFMSKTIDDFKEFYKPSKVKEDFYVQEALESAITVLSANIKKSNIDLNYNFDANEDIKVHGIKNELSQVILALLSNSSEALKSIEEPYINLYVTANDAEVIIKVKDNAQGIKEEDLEKIFDPYFSTKKSGTGLGLYLVKMIIDESFQGSIEVENKTQGAQFTLRFEKAI